MGRRQGKSTLPHDAERETLRAKSVTPSERTGVPGWWSWAAALGGGLAGALAFDPVAWRPLVVLAALGCFLAIRWARGPLAAFYRAWAFGWVYFFGVLHWLLTIRVYAPDPALGVAAVIALGGYLGLFIAALGFALRKWLWTGCASGQFARFAALWLLVEWLRTMGKLGMSLGQLGHAWATVPEAIQIAQWLGELGVSLEVLYLAGVIFLAARWWVVRRRPELATGPNAARRLGFVVSVMGVGAVLWGGASVFIAQAWKTRVDQALASPASPKLNVALVQPNIPQMTKLASNSWPDEGVQAKLHQEIRQRTETMLAAQAHGQWDLILLPETAYTELDFNLNEPLKQRVSETVRAAGGDMLVSATRKAHESEYYNTAFFVHQDGTFDTAYYDKIRLVPFGENLPYFDWIPGVRSVVGFDPLSAGQTQTMFTTQGARFGVLICFESTFSSLARGLVKRGADFLTVVTNDAWYGMSVGPTIHHNVSLLRAVETRRWLLRCANTGISSIITPAGTVAATLELGQQGIVPGTIAPEVYRGRTVFVTIGNAWLALPALVLLGGAAVRRRAEKRAEFVKQG